MLKCTLVICEQHEFVEYYYVYDEMNKYLFHLPPNHLCMRYHDNACIFHYYP